MAKKAVQDVQPADRRRAQKFPTALTDADTTLLSELRELFTRFNRALEVFCQIDVPNHPMRRRSDIQGYATAGDVQTVEPVERRTKAVWAIPHEPVSPRAEPAPSTHPRATGIARVVYRPIRRTYRGRAVQPDLSGLQPVVRKVYDAVIKAPGANTDRYISLTRMNKNTVRYGLQILRQLKLVESTPAE